MVEAVLPEVVQHLLQMVRVEAHAQVVRHRRDLDFANRVRTAFAVDGDRVLEEFAERQALRGGGLAPREAQHVGDDLVDAHAMTLDHVEQTLVGRADPRRFGQQLSGVPDRRQRIADFVRDTGGQPAQRGQLELLRLFPHACGIVEQHQHRRPGAVAKPREARQQLRAVDIQE